MPETPKPKWLQEHDCVIWQEDDAKPPDAETLHGAWLRYFGEELPRTTVAAATFDMGDAVADLYEKGVAVYGCEGAEIRVRRSSMYYDWTRDETGRSNSSAEFKQIEKAIASVIASNGHSVFSKEWPLFVGGLIAAQLAHVYKMRPVKPPERKF